MRAGVVRAEGLHATTVAAADLILIQQQQTNGQFLPREVSYANFITGGGTGLTANSVVLTNASGDLTTDAGITYASSVLTVTTTGIVSNSYVVGNISNNSTLTTLNSNGSQQYLAVNTPIVMTNGISGQIYAIGIGFAMP